MTGEPKQIQPMHFGFARPKNVSRHNQDAPDQVVCYRQRMVFSIEERATHARTELSAKLYRGWFALDKEKATPEQSHQIDRRRATSASAVLVTHGLYTFLPARAC